MKGKKVWIGAFIVLADSKFKKFSFRGGSVGFEAETAWWKAPHPMVTRKQRGPRDENAAF